MPASPGLSPDQADLLAAAKLWLTSAPAPGGPHVGDMPYLATALYALLPVPTDRVATMTTDPSWRLYVNPGWLDDADRGVPEVAAELAHHVWHLLADHAGRATDMRVSAATSRAWRVAADVTIHPVVAGLAPSAPRGSQPRPVAGPRTPGINASRGPSGGIGTPAQVRAARTRAMADDHAIVPPATLGLPPGLSAEEYYAILSGLPAGEPEDPPDPAWAPRRGSGAASGDAAGEPGADPSCGSGCDGVQRGYELADPASTGGLGEVAAAAIRRTVAIAFRAAHGRGSAPGEWDRWVERVLDPIVDWRTVLHAAVRRGLGWANGHTDYTYTRISRRQAAAGTVILPALRRPAPRVGVVLDTSGSVDDGLLAQALGEVDGVLATLGVSDPQVSVLAVDAAVQAVSTVRRADAVRLAGGGGTDMALGIGAALGLRPRVDVIIVLTDGYTGWPAQPPAVPVVAVLMGRSRPDLPATPPWVQRVECVP